MSRIAVIGANGQLGRYLIRVFQESGKNEVVPFTHRGIEVANPKTIEHALSAQTFDLVINTAAAHGQDTEIELEKTFAVNALGPKYLATYCEKARMDLVHFSTDYVFRGNQWRPYTENDCPEPVNAYGISKLAGELFIKSMMSRFYIVRVSALYGIGGCRAKNNSNFVEVILRKASLGETIQVVEDQHVTPTYALDVAETLLALVQTRRYGVYHMTNGGACSWYDFAKEIARLAGMEADFLPIKTAASVSDSKRPMYSVLENRNLRAAGIRDLRPWPEALAAYFKERGTTVQRNSLP